MREASTSSDKKNQTVTESLMQATGMSALMGSLNETTLQLHQRGEKLDQLSEKTSRLALNANKFADLAKELNNQKSSWW